LQVDSPFNVKLLDVNAYVKNFLVQPVLDLSFYEPSSGNAFAKTGLFSENIFGSLGSTERMVTFGYIALNTSVLQPLIYKNLVKLASLYEEIITGTSYALFDPIKFDFIRCPDPEQHNDAGTGYTFFMNHFNDIKFSHNESTIRSDRIAIIEKFKDILFCDKFLVLPAGLRDLAEDQGQLTTDDINKLYQTLLSYSFSIPPNTKSTIYDGVRNSIQKKVVEIYDYIENILTGKKGFIQGVWGHRHIALGTRNVITAATYATMTPNDPQTLQPDETKLGLFQTAKALQPIVVHHVRTNFFAPVFGEGSNLVPLTDPKTYELAYRTLNNKELARFDNPEAIEDWITRFQNVDIRNQPVTIHDTTGQPFYLLMVYDEGDEINLFRSLNEFKNVFSREIDRSKIRPLTWAELLYMAVYNASVGKHVFITRYPVIQDESCYPTLIHLVSTQPSRVVRLMNTVIDQVVHEYPEYPILGKPFLDSIQVGTARLAGLDGDFDGDTVSANALLSDEANEEVHEFLNSIQSVVNTQKEILIGGRDHLVAYSLRSLSVE
jgi:hypothetical protein